MLSNVVLCIHNAVAPDWNLKLICANFGQKINANAVAPDWNLKQDRVQPLFQVNVNAVAPDWNLKFAKLHHWYVACEMQSHQIGI